MCQLTTYKLFKFIPLEHGEKRAMSSYGHDWEEPGNLHYFTWRTTFYGIIHSLFDCVDVGSPLHMQKS